MASKKWGQYGCSGLLSLPSFSVDAERSTIFCLPISNDGWFKNALKPLAHHYKHNIGRRPIAQSLHRDWSPRSAPSDKISRCFIYSLVKVFIGNMLKVRVGFLPRELKSSPAVMINFWRRCNSDLGCSIKPESHLKSSLFWSMISSSSSEELLLRQGWEDRRRLNFRLRMGGDGMVSTLVNDEESQNRWSILLLPLQKVKKCSRKFSLWNEILLTWNLMVWDPTK